MPFPTKSNTRVHMLSLLRDKSWAEVVLYHHNSVQSNKRCSPAQKQLPTHCGRILLDRDERACILFLLDKSVLEDIHQPGKRVKMLGKYYIHLTLVFHLNFKYQRGQFCVRTLSKSSTLTQVHLLTCSHLFVFFSVWVCLFVCFRHTHTSQNSWRTERKMKGFAFLTEWVYWIPVWKGYAMSKNDELEYKTNLRFT